MAKARKRQEPRVAERSPGSAWARLTWDDLHEWAGEPTVSRGRSYQRNGLVSQLCISESGMLLAWVRGSHRYATRVEIDAAEGEEPEQVVSKCSCPVRFGCKHAVAVVVEFLEALQAGVSVPGIPEGDWRLSVIEGRFGDVDDDDVEPGDEREDEPRRRETGTRARAKRIGDRDIRNHLASKSAEELMALVMQACARDSEFRKALVDACALAEGRFGELLAETLAELRSLTAEEAWRDSWTGDGNVPDYSRLERRLKTLLDHGQADAVVELGEELLRRATDQIEESRDDGMTAFAIGGCMGIVYEALLRSSRGDADKILYAIDTVLADEYDLCAAFATVGDRSWRKATWSSVADRLRKRLDGSAASDDGDEWSASLRRGRLVNWTVAALDKAGRADEATELCVVEARASRGYLRAVRRLIEAGEADRGKDLALEGLEATDPERVGDVARLQDLLCEIAASRGDWMLPACVAADRFFGAPSVGRYRELLQAAEKTGHVRIVQSAVVAFLESGRRPDRYESAGKSTREASSWPLPEPPRPRARRTGDRHERVGPHFDVLIDLAIEEKRPDDVLAWFDKRNASDPPAGYRWQRRPFRNDARVATAVEGTHPNRAIDLYLQLANAIAAETDPKSYPEAVAHLKRIKTLLEKAGREQDWPDIVGGFRTEHRRKRRLMEALDGIEGQPIVKGKRR